MALLGKVLSALVTFVLGAAALGGYLYLTDYAVQATVTDKGSDPQGDYVVVTPKLFAYDYKKYLDSSSAAYVCRGYQVEFQVQSQQYRVYDADGDLVYDSKRGLVDAASAIRCRASNGGGGLLG